MIPPLFAAAVIAQSAPTTSPITVKDCSVAQWQTIGAHPYWNPFISTITPPALR